MPVLPTHNTAHLLLSADGVSQPHEPLIAFQRADALCVGVYRVTTGFPAAERFSLTAQLRRAAYSVPANIVEGLAHPSARWKLRHLRISAGSLAELGYGMSVAARLGYIEQSTAEALAVEIRRTAAPLQGLIVSIERTRV